MLVFLAELNGLETWATDIASAYLEAYTDEKVYIIAGPEFGDLEGHTVIIEKALYGLRTSGARYHDRFADTLRDMGFTQCKNEPDLWMRDAGTHYEFICVYVDDLMAIMKDPARFFETLRKKYRYKLKGVEEPSYHLGGDFFRDPDGTLAWGAKRYIVRLLENYTRDHGSPPPKFRSPMAKDCHPELDRSIELGLEGIKKYQSWIGALQWVVTLGRFDVQVAVMTLSSFRVAPRLGHWECIIRVLGYLRMTKDGAIRFRLEELELEDYMKKESKYDWSSSVYAGVTEDIPEDCPVPRGKSVQLSTYVDASLLHCRVTGRSVSGIIHFLNNTVIDTFCRKQNVVEAATYGSEFYAARLSVQQIIDLRITLRYMGVPLKGPAFMFGDNESVVKSSTIPSSTLKKRHNSLSYHTVRAAIAAGFIKFWHIPGKENIADVLTKHLEPGVLGPLVRPHLFWQGPKVAYRAKRAREDD